MAKTSILADTDVFIDYINHRLFSEIFEGPGIEIYYSVVTRKELLGKEGLKDAERRMILKKLKQYRMVALNQQILEKYSVLRKNHPTSEKEDCLVAATALVKNLPLFTRNLKYYKVFEGLILFKGPLENNFRSERLTVS